MPSPAHIQTTRIEHQKSESTFFSFLAAVNQLLQTFCMFLLLFSARASMSEKRYCEKCRAKKTLMKWNGKRVCTACYTPPKALGKGHRECPICPNVITSRALLCRDCGWVKEKQKATVPPEEQPKSKRRAKPCPKCFALLGNRSKRCTCGHVFLSDQPQGGNQDAKGQLGNRGNPDAKGQRGNLGNPNGKGQRGNRGNPIAKGKQKNRGNPDAKGKKGNKGNCTSKKNENEEPPPNFSSAEVDGDGERYPTSAASLQAVVNLLGESDGWKFLHERPRDYCRFGDPAAQPTAQNSDMTYSMQVWYIYKPTTSARPRRSRAVPVRA